MIRKLQFPTLMAPVLLLLLGSGASAATCTGNMSNINFGSVSVREGVVNQTSGNLQIDCSGAAAGAVGICIRFGPGSGGAGGSNSPRYMRRGDGAILAYELRPNGNGGTNGTWNSAFVVVPITLGSGNVSVPVYADITSNSVSVGVGSYSSIFSGASNASLTVDVPSCLVPGSTTALADFTVSAEVVASCELDVTALSFGTISSQIASPVDGEAIVNVRCTDATVYSVTMGLGNGPGVTNPANRKMTNGGSVLSYGLYQDSARTQIWGMLPGNDFDAVGAGTNQAIPVYGRINAGQSAITGLYSDSVIVTINY